MYEFKAEMKTVGTILLKWEFFGPQGLNHALRVVLIEWYFPDRRPIKLPPMNISVNGPGSYVYNFAVTA